MKGFICTVAGAVGSFLAYIFGGWDAAIFTLFAFMVIDYATGVLVAGVFHKSSKTESGALNSRVGWKGLAKKCVTLLFVVIAVLLDYLMVDMLGFEMPFVRDAVCIAFIVNELISIVENAGLMGIPIPAIITKSIDILKQKGDEDA